MLVFLFVLFSFFFASEIKTGMECHTCFIVQFRSVCVDNHDSESIKKAALYEFMFYVTERQNQPYLDVLCASQY